MIKSKKASCKVKVTDLEARISDQKKVCCSNLSSKQAARASDDNGYPA